ncbi:(4Fe-4S)-binding protein [Chloroflexota bacterium]
MKKIKVIKIDADKCTGCRSCEVICSTIHAVPKYSSTNPERSRIRVLSDPYRNAYVPLIAGPYTEAECNGRYMYRTGGREYDECGFCRASCPSRDIFKDPDSGLPLKCDMCESESSQGPMCVQWCLNDTLTYEEREEEGEEEEKRPGEIETGLQELVNKHGLKGVMDVLTRISKD